MDDLKGDEQTRRTFCVRAASLAVFGGALGTLLQGCSSPTAPSSAPSLSTVSGIASTNGSTRQVTVAIDSASPLAAVGAAALVQSSLGSFLVGHTSPDTYVALTSVCTHQTCTISGFQNQSYVCPCHGSTFDMNGHVQLGPAAASLRQYPSQFANGVLTISA